MVLKEIWLDWTKNYNNPKGLIILFLYRLTHVTYMGSRKFIPLWIFLIPLVLIYKIVTELLLSVEISFKAKIGAPLTLHHAYATVINQSVILGSDCVLRHSTTIGVAKKNGGCPKIGNRVEIGAGSIIIGEIEIGDDCIIGAGSVVVKSVAKGDVVAGNPAKSLRRTSR